MTTESAGSRTISAYIVGICGSFLVVGLLAWAIHRYTQPPPLGEDRAAVRAKALAELRAAEAEALSTAAWIDQGKGVVRLPVERAMELVLEEWKHPASARSNLVARVEKATALPPKPPQKPSEFE